MPLQPADWWPLLHGESLAYHSKGSSSSSSLSRDANPQLHPVGHPSPAKGLKLIEFELMGLGGLIGSFAFPASFPGCLSAVLLLCLLRLLRLLLVA